jgi:serine/threonine protein kinase
MIGRQVSHFYIIRTLGSGGMGVVYEAQDTRLPRSVAVKVLKPALAKDIAAIRRFKREARLAASLNHPNICTILDIDEGHEQAFIAMELLRGKSLKAQLTTGALPLEQTLEIATQVADALAAAHDHGIVHRDLTPGNIFLTSSGLVKLLDFGLAKHFTLLEDDEPLSHDLTSTGAIAGTVHYMAPEQLSSDATIDYRSDLFSFGAVLYQMATGARPFDGPTKNDVIGRILSQRQLPLHQLAPGVPAHLERLVDKLLEKRPDDRYQTAQAIGAELDRIKHDVALLPEGREDRERRRASIAVLPCEVIGVLDPLADLFRKGLADEISSRLSGIRELRVAPRTSTNPLVGESVREIGARLRVEMVLEGSVQQVDDRVRVIANLIDAPHERSIRPALRIDRRCTDILTLQDEIARDIVDGVASSMARTSAKRYTQDPEAYHAFKRGLHDWKSCFSGGWRSAIENFQEAIARDPEFALAYVALANAYNFLGLYSLMKPNIAFGVARQSAERSLEVEDTLAAGHAELALAKFGGEWDWDESEREFRRALNLDPANPLTRIYYSWLLMLLGRDDAASAEAQAGHALAPSSRLVRCGQAQTLYLAGRYDEAIELCRESLRFDADYAFALHLRGLLPTAITPTRRPTSSGLRQPVAGPRFISACSACVMGKPAVAIRR